MRRWPGACTTLEREDSRRPHRHGGQLVFQIGTGYFGCRDEQGRFSLGHLRERLSEAPVRALEVKLSQGAKPGLGGLLPARKVSREIAAIRGVAPGEDCVSPPAHSAFSNVEELHRVRGDARRRDRSAGGHQVGGRRGRASGRSSPSACPRRGGGPDFISIDGGEGGTGAGPLAFSDHVALPFKVGFARVYSTFARAGLAEDVVFIGAGRLGFPDSALFAFALGCDMVSVGREAMLAAGCIQAMRCHTGRCPTGVATQSRWLMRGLDPEVKFHRVANYLVILRARAPGPRTLLRRRPSGPGDPDHIEIVGERYSATRVADVFGYSSDWPVLSGARHAEIEALAGVVGEGELSA